MEILQGSFRKQSEGVRLESNRYKNIILQVIGQAIAALLSLYISSFVVENIGASVFGFVGLANNFVSYASLAAVALNSIASRFIAFEVYKKNEKAANEYYATTFLTNLIIAAAVVLVGGIFIWKMDIALNVPLDYLHDIQLLWIMILAGFVLDLLSTAFKASTFVTNKIYLNSLATVIGVIIRAVIILGMFAVYADKIWFVGFGTMTSMLLQLIIHFNFARKLTPQLHIRTKCFKTSRLGTLLKSGIWNTISQLGKLLSEGLDLLITNIFISDSSMGIVSISKTLSTYIQLLNGTIAGTMVPKLTYHYSRNEIKQYHKQLFSDMQLLSFTSGLMLSILVIFADSFYALWVPSQDARQLMILTVLGSFWMSVSGVMGSIFNAFTVQNKLRFNSIAMIISGIASTLMLIITLKLTDLGIYAVAGISSVIYIVKNLFFIIPYAEKVIGIKAIDIYKRVLKSVLATTTTILVFRSILSLFDLGSWLRLIISGGIVTIIITVIFVFVYFPMNQIKSGILSMKKRLFR